MTPKPSELLTALDQRLTEAASVLLDTDVLDLPESERPGMVSGHLLPRLIALCADQRRQDARWLLLTATFGAFPTTDQFREFERNVELAPVGHTESALLAQVINDPGRGRVDLPMTIVADGTVVEVDFCARYDTHTGIHRVVRETMPRWSATHTVTAVAWIDQYTAFRTLAPREVSRVFAHEQPVSVDPVSGPKYRPRLVVPWQSVLVLPDVPSARASGQLAALAKFSGNTVSMIGYDMIPITSADLRPPDNAVSFAQYLTVVKHAHRVAGISRSAAAEFAGFTHSLTAQGLPGPDVREVLLAGRRLTPLMDLGATTGIDQSYCALAAKSPTRTSAPRCTPPSGCGARDWSSRFASSAVPVGRTRCSSPLSSVWLMADARSQRLVWSAM